MKRCNTCANEVAFSTRTLANGVEKKYENNYCNSCRLRRHRFGLNDEELIKLNQINSCAICEKEISGKGKHIDHDHTDGKIRGILCSSCNRGLGRFYDNPRLLRLAANYLQSNRQK